MNFVGKIADRGLVASATSTDVFKREPEQLTAYIGFDLTANCLHVGSLIQIMMLRQWQAAGAKAYALLGWNTTRIGDPSGKTEARKMLTKHEIEDNAEAIRALLIRLIPGINIIHNMFMNNETILIG